MRQKEEEKDFAYAAINLFDYTYVSTTTSFTLFPSPLVSRYHSGFAQFNQANRATFHSIRNYKLSMFFFFFWFVPLYSKGESRSQSHRSL